jgi:hypothetical protein
MKFVPRRRTEYDNSGIMTTYDYVTSADILARHGQIFATQFESFATGLPQVSADGRIGYYYEDYKKIAYRTDMFLGNG